MTQTFAQKEKELKDEIENRKGEIIKEHKRIIKEVGKKETDKYCKLQLKEELKYDAEIDELKAKLSQLQEDKAIAKEEHDRREHTYLINLQCARDGTKEKYKEEVLKVIDEWFKELNDVVNPAIQINEITKNKLVSRIEEVFK